MRLTPIESKFFFAPPYSLRSLLTMASLDTCSDTTESSDSFEWIRATEEGASIEELCEKYPVVKALVEKFEVLSDK